MVSRRELALALVVAAGGFAATAWLYRPGREIFVDFERGYEGGMITGFNARERADGAFYRWTKDVSYIDFLHLPSRGELTVDVKLRVRRPGGEPLPNLAFTANGATVHTTPGLPGTVSYELAFPTTSSRLRLGIRSDTFDPSGERPLGVQVLAVTVRFPDAEPSWVTPALWMGVAAAFLFAAAWVATGAGAVSAGAAAVFSAAFIYLLAQHAVRYSSYPRDVAVLAAVTLGVAWLGRWLQWREEKPHAIVTATIAAVFVAEMAVAFYPLTLMSDADFQANRMLHFLEGDWHPTSVTQHDPPFTIPYPVSLYAVSAPLVALGMERVPALVATTAVFDVVVSIVLILLGWRFLDDVRGGVLAALLYQLVPMNALSFSAGNFTNLFAVSALSLAFLFLFSRPIACGLLACIALTAHFGMLIEGLVLFPVWLASLWLGPKPVKDDRKRLTLALVTAFVVAGVYYLGYLSLVTEQLGQARSLTSGGGGGTGGWQSSAEQLGWVFLAVAVLGAVALAKTPHRSTFRTLTLAWLGVSLLFLVVDLVSVVEIRYALQALPLLALCGGSYLSSALGRGRLGRGAALAAILYIGVMGLSTLQDVALVRYH